MKLLLTLAACAAAQQLDLQLSEDGSFEIAFDGVAWLRGGDVLVDGRSAAAGDFTLAARTRGAGVDALGAFAATSFFWEADCFELAINATFKTYADDPSIVVFEQAFPYGLGPPAAAGARAALAARTLFPAFERAAPAGAPALACFAYHGVFPQMASCTPADYAESAQGGAPLVLYDARAAGGALPMLVFSPLDRPKAQHMATTDRLFGAGVKASAASVPAGWSQRWLLSAGAGVNAGMMRWGDAMLRFAGKPRVDQRYRDVTHGSIGFWTDNGGYYHYSVGDNASLGATYEEVLPKVKAYHDAIGVPFRHWQFDSWFYPKDGAVDAGGGGGAVTNWTSLDDVFPSGMAAIHDALGVPMVMHNRQWSNVSDYIKHAPFAWYADRDGGAAAPADPEAFFAWFFEQQAGWGLTMYEQDWLCEEYDHVDALRTNVSLGDAWLAGLASGAARNNLTVQWCMPYAHDVLAAAALPAVTNARATGDYKHAADQWAIGGTSLFYWALNVLPFKDGFYSSTLPQTGGQTEEAERAPDREALVSALSGAMVAPMDGIYLLNASRVLRTCRADGLVLKPDAPLATTDWCFRDDGAAARPAGGPEACRVYHAHSDVPGYGRVHYHFDNNDGALAATALEPAMLSFVGAEANASAPHVVYDWYAAAVAGTLASAASAAVRVAAGYENVSYALVAPVVAGWALLGEVDKYVPASTLRFPRARVDDAGAFDVDVEGLAGEQVRACAARVEEDGSAALRCETVVFETPGTQTVAFSAE